MGGVVKAWPAWALRLGLGPQRAEEIFETASSPIAREYLATTRAIAGALLFHKWAASQLPPNVRAHYGDRFVLGAHHLLAGDVFTRTMFHELAEQKLFNPKPVPSVSLCSPCPCKKNGVNADCVLIDGFHGAYKDITAKSIEQWYSGLTGQDAVDVRAFFRVAAPTHPPIREAFGQILTEELLQREGLQVNVNVEGKRTPPRKTLRDAFALTAMVAIKGWLNPSSTDMDSCAEVVAAKFEMSSADIIWNQWKDVEPENRESDAHR